MKKMHDLVIEGNDKVTGDTRVIPTVEHEDDEIQWACSMSISTDSGDPETLKEALTKPNGHFWKMSAISEVSNFLSRKAWIPKKISAVKSKGRKPVPVKWVFKSREEPDGLNRLKSRNVVKGCMQVPEVYFIESFPPVASDTSTRILIGLTLYYEDDGWIAMLCEV